MSKMPKVLAAGPKLQQRALAERRDRRHRGLRIATWVLAGVVPFVLAGWVLLGSSLLAVDKVVVTGEHRLTAAEVEHAVGISAGTPLARVDTAAVSRRVRALDAVASVSVTRSWPDALHVTIVERTAAVAVADAGSFDLLDVSGVQLDRVPEVPRGILRLQTKPADTAATRAALAVLTSLPTALRSQVQLLRAPSSEDVQLVLRDQRVVVWGSASGAKEKGAAALALLRMPGTVFDVSSPSVVTRR
jgi:cell division protein FtsQ